VRIVDQYEEPYAVVHKVGFEEKEVTFHLVRAAREGLHAASVRIIGVVGKGYAGVFLCQFFVIFPAVAGADDDLLLRR